ncbi:MAG: hypothetical protein HY261_06320 [Chloroflexi bacterium]|nr:hypothetical protein [Chloroflexota bacterium]
MASPVRAAEPTLALDASANVSAARPGEHGFVVHEVRSGFQPGMTEIHVLVPAKLAEKARIPVLYLLPVEATNSTRWGSALAEAHRLGLADRLNAICVYPTFSQLPWYVDHPADARIRQESYFLRVVVPFIEARYPARREREGRLLLGFSKSGWGAWSLLLRHPDVFGRAAAWDAPTAMDAPRYGMDGIIGSREAFAKYELHTVLRAKGRELGPAPRLALLGYGNFREQMTQTHALMDSLGIPHEWRDGPQRQHHWESGWVEDAARWLTQKGDAR